jgi:hypothetical protein
MRLVLGRAHRPSCSAAFCWSHSYIPPAACAGHDDALAILLAGYHPKVKLCGISTVASNQVTPYRCYERAAAACSWIQLLGQLGLLATHLCCMLLECVESGFLFRLCGNLIASAVLVQVVEKTTRNALDIVDWLGLQDVGEAVVMLLCSQVLPPDHHKPLMLCNMRDLETLNTARVRCCSHTNDNQGMCGSQGAVAMGVTPICQSMEVPAAEIRIWRLQDLSHTSRTRQMLLCCLHLGCSTGVVRGQAGPLMREIALICPEIHGETGARTTKLQASPQDGRTLAGAMQFTATQQSSCKLSSSFKI